MKFRSKILTSLSTILIIIGIGIGQLTIRHMNDFSSGWSLLIIFIIGIIVYFIGSSSMEKELNFDDLDKKTHALSANIILKKDSRPPVIYLRSFCNDITTGFVLNHLNFVETTKSEEEQLAKVLNDIGPFIAIGKPGEVLPTLGAARWYVEDKNWKDNIINKLQIAKLVVIRIGATKGLIWEIQETIKQVKYSNILLLVPNDRFQYEDFLTVTKGLFKYNLPSYPISKNLMPDYRTIRGFIYFSEDGTAIYKDFKPPPLFLSRKYEDLVPIFKLGFKPIFEQNGWLWKSPKINWILLIITIFLPILVLLEIFVFLK
jgi:hypothetical protein